MLEDMQRQFSDLRQMMGFKGGWRHKSGGSRVSTNCRRRFVTHRQKIISPKADGVVGKGIRHIIVTGAPRSRCFSFDTMEFP